MIRVLDWLLGPEAASASKTAHRLPRWLFLRALGLVYLSAFYSLLFQIKGLIGPHGILPASNYLYAVSHYFPGLQRLWYAPTLLWWWSSDRALMTICWVGLAASVAVIINLWPRATLAVCLLCFLSFVAAGQDFANYQSDGMLLEAGFISIFFAPAGLHPRDGPRLPFFRSVADMTARPFSPAGLPSRASLFLLSWEWFRIYFESGVVKLVSGDYSWRHLTAMDDYYQNGPLPTWVGWYVQQLPHKFHAVTAFVTLAAELVLAFMMFLPRRGRILCFCILTPFQAGIILTANYTFLNYLVLSLGVLLLDDGFLNSLWPRRWNRVEPETQAPDPANTPAPGRWSQLTKILGRCVAGISLAWVFYATTALLLETFPQAPRLPDAPVRALAPFRIANGYGLFAVMTHERYEIEFQGSADGQTWIAYPFRYKPQDVRRAPGIYAPYQPRFEWNLWFASLESWRQNPFVLAHPGASSAQRS